MSPTLHTRSLRRTPEDIAVIERCFADNGMPRPRALFDWLYLRSPAGALYVDIAEDRSGPAPVTAAVYCTLAVRMRVRGEVKLGLQSLDTLTDERYRGKGLFVSLARGLFERAQKDGVSLVYGFPNGSSAHGFFKKLEWRSLDPMPFLIRPLRVGYAVSRLAKRELPAILGGLALPLVAPPRPSGAEVRVATRFDDEHAALWAKMARGVDLAVERDAAYLNWRFVEKPEMTYRTLELRRRGELVAFVVTSVQDKHGGRVAYVMDVVFAPGAGVAATALLGEALRRDVRDGADVALAWSLPGAPGRLVHHAMGFVPLPERMRPIELHAGARPFATGLDAIIDDRRAWYLSYADSDTV